MTTACDLVREHLDSLLDGDLEPALRDHVADCDVCRDLRHDARRAADAVRDAGADYVHPADFEARLLAAIDARPAPVAADEGRITLTDGSLARVVTVASASGATAAAAPAVSVTTTTTTSAPVSAAVPASSATDPSVEPRAAQTDAATPAAAPVARTEQMPAHAAPRPLPVPAPAATGAPDRPRRKLPRSPAFWVVGAAITAAAAASPFLFRTTPHPNRPSAAATTAAAAREAWRGRLELVARASTDPAGGVEIKRMGDTAFSPLAAESEIPAGAEIRTDPRTRARIALADGTQIVLDRASVLRFDHALPRTAALVSGALVADVAHIDDAPDARIALPTGGITVVGTKFALTAADDRSTVRVTRGIVRMNATAGAEVEVKTGEEGVLAAGGAPEVAPAVGLAESVAWSEFGGPRTAEPDAPILGLGELRARRPGHTDENDHQVTLAGHSVRVRIVGNVARTEIDETFRNDTNNELEGIYRFPLPPEAQIEKLSLDVRGHMEDGAFVDRQRAAAIWRGVIRNAVHPILQEQQTDELVWVPGPWRDPALLEWQRGGRFELRIFPIPAHGTRRVAIAYTQTIAPSGGVRRYVYPLAHDAAGSTRVEQFSVDVQVLGNDTALGVRPRGYALAVDPAAPAGAATHLT
ncbi:MAG: VIT domain-containing protein [Deltaproteobacteria bacterium]